MSVTKKNKAFQGVTFIVCRYPLGISLMIVNSIKMFAQKGISVDVYISKNSFDECPISFNDPHIHIHIFEDKGFGFFHKAYRFLMKNTSNLLYPLLQRTSIGTSLMLTYPEVYRFSKWLNSFTKFDHYDYICAVDFYSLISLYDLARRHKIVYYNMELLDGNPVNTVFGNTLMLKALEYRLMPYIHTAVLPSPTRSEFFQNINNFPPKKIKILPVAAMGNPSIKKAGYFRKKFSIPDDHVIILYSGNFVSWFQCVEIIDAMNSCRGGCSLIMHTWSQSSLSTGYFQNMVKHAHGLPVFFSTDYISPDNLTDALSSADIGLAFYNAIDENCSEILYSSNKIGEYLKAGLAVITSDFRSLSNFVHRHRIGLAVPVSNLSTAIEKISDQLDQYKANALECYSNYYRFELHFEGFYKFLYPLSSVEKPDKP